MNSKAILDESAIDQFVQAWGTLGSSWGINKTMAQIHALLLLEKELASAEDIMEKLDISRGNVNMNLRVLMEWGLVYKESVKGERKEFFRAEKDIWKVSRRITEMRRQKELAPLLRFLEEFVPEKPATKNKSNNQEAGEMLLEIKKFAIQIDTLLEKYAKSERKWFMNVLKKIL